MEYVKMCRFLQIFMLYIAHNQYMKCRIFEITVSVLNEFGRI